MNKPKYAPGDLSADVFYEFICRPNDQKNAEFILKSLYLLNIIDEATVNNNKQAWINFIGEIRQKVSSEKALDSDFGHFATHREMVIQDEISNHLEEYYSEKTEKVLK